MTRPGRELFVVRHGKSDWDSEPAADFDRPLAKRGKRDCRTMATWCAQQGLLPDVVLASSAERAADTARRLARGLGVEEDDITFDDVLYLASLPTLLDALARVDPAARQVLLVGHNPGLDELVRHLASATPRLSASGKLMTTAAVAHFRLPDDWSDLPRGSGELLDLARPKELPDF